MEKRLPHFQNREFITALMILHKGIFPNFGKQIKNISFEKLLSDFEKFSDVIFFRENFINNEEDISLEELFYGFSKGGYSPCSTQYEYVQYEYDVKKPDYWKNIVNLDSSKFKIFISELKDFFHDDTKEEDTRNKKKILKRYKNEEDMKEDLIETYFYELSRSEIVSSNDVNSLIWHLAWFLDYNSFYAGSFFGNDREIIDKFHILKRKGITISIIADALRYTNDFPFFFR